MKRMKDSQMKALQRFIMESHDASDFAKKAILFALRHTNNLTEPICLSLPPLFDEKLAGEVQDGVHDMLSCNGTTRIDLFLKGMGTKMAMSHHCGVYTCRGFDSKVGGRTIWVSPEYHDDRAPRMIVRLVSVIDSVELPKEF